MIIASFNVNSVRQRLEHLSRWLVARSPDIVCLQELKCLDEAFPRAEIEALGYNVATHGQKTFNGVAILSKHPMEIEQCGLPGFEDEQARYIEAVVSLPGKDNQQGEAIRVCGVYFPNGNPAPGPKYDYKMAFMAALTEHAKELLTYEEKLVIAGDYNIIPEARDAKFPEAWTQDALALPESRAALGRLVNLGFTDALRATTDSAGLYTFWDYQAGAWQRNNGIRIDHLLLSPRAADRLIEVGIDKDMRAEEKPSDHVPIWCRLG
ncbi:MAG: exodeoxyribonuclease III [Rhizobiales bacterium PAR1]|nr:MAG: exodeoxyribonuclease III [Rhizobiales bacterium PAR1]